MIDYSFFYNALQNIPSLASWGQRLPEQVNQKIYDSNDGNLPRWLNALKNLPNLKPSHIELDSNSVTVGTPSDCDAQQRQRLENILRELHPWRKGPFNIFGIHVDAEWRSDMKWNRLKDHITSLKDRVVLDVGANNGYHCWRMASAGAKLALGIDPTLLYVCQYHAVQHFIDWQNVAVLPLGIDDMPMDLNVFDTVFSMGLLYHRRAPFDHLLHLQSFLREGGELVLETLVIDGKAGDVLSPCGRYAKMPNVWFIPSCLTLEHWLKRCQFKDIRCIDVCQTSIDEQRVTDWMGFQSLFDFLDPKDRNLTIEGYPSPRRAIFVAKR
ncbi:tRNA (mo5U34)-methyltransferase [hydrothermal vent metagenome]|uniref:tRNA (Mo5U34)-methyltransferase n=1 Tax=hydrothermal vent metagenome TaxID=652676 RepID=A0A3B1D1A5_9ZZZZ